MICYPIKFNPTVDIWHELCIKVEWGTVLPHKGDGPVAEIPLRAFS